MKRTRERGKTDQRFTADLHDVAIELTWNYYYPDRPVPGGR